MNASDLIAEFAQRAGLAELRLSAEGTAALVVNDILTVNIEHDDAGRRLYLYCALGEPPAEGREAYFGQLLEANLFGRQTGGASIGLDRANNAVLLTRTLDLDTADFPAFEAALEQLVHGHTQLAIEIGEAARQHRPGVELDPRLAGMMRA
jgi:Tir chaperone protein (CesT) family